MKPKFSFTFIYIKILIILTFTTYINTIKTEQHFLTKYPTPLDQRLPQIRPMNKITNTINNPNAVIYQEQDPTCLCASTFKCKPCGIIDYSGTYSDPRECPCAKCPPCPLASMIHDMGEKKAKQDQILVSKLKKMTTKLNQYLDALSKYTTDIVKYEGEAKAKSLLMEESEIKSMIARQNMIEMSEKARLIAKRGIVVRTPCFGPGCPDDILSDKIFLPEEINSVKDYIQTSMNNSIDSENSDPEAEPPYDDNKNDDDNSTDNTNDDSNETPHIINKRKKKSNID